MDTENFDKLRRLLAWKRHEQPPPGYFQHFSDQVISRLEAEVVLREVSWWRRFLPTLDLKPILACAYGLAIGGALTWGISFASGDRPETAQYLPTETWLAVAPALGLSVNVDNSSASGHSTRLTSSKFVSEPSSVHPVFSSGPPSFLINAGYPNAQVVRFNRE